MTKIKSNKRKSKIVLKEEHGKKPQIIVKDIELNTSYYRTTGIKVGKDKYFIYHQNDSEFYKGFNKLKRSYNFNNNDVKVLGTKTHRYASTTFIASGFKP